MQLHDFLDANFIKRSGDLFRQLDWLSLKDDVNLQKCRLTLRRIKTNETIQAIQRTLLPRKVDTRSVKRVSRYGMYNLVCNVTIGKLKWEYFLISWGQALFYAMYERKTPLTPLKLLLKIFLSQFQRV